MSLVTRSAPQPWPRVQAIGDPSGNAASGDASGERLASLLVQRLAEARNYWLATTRPDGRPHVTPLWGVWADNAFFCQGAPSSRWILNLNANPAAALHLESGKDVVIVNGMAAHVYTDEALAAHIAELWREKYGGMEPEASRNGVVQLVPRSVLAWGEPVGEAVRWVFPTP